MWGFHRGISRTAIFLSAVFQKTYGFSEGGCKWCIYEWLQSHEKHSSPTYVTLRKFPGNAQRPWQLKDVKGEEVEEKWVAKLPPQVLNGLLGQEGRCAVRSLLLMTITITTATGIVIDGPNLLKVTLLTGVWRGCRPEGKGDKLQVILHITFIISFFQDLHQGLMHQGELELEMEVPGWQGDR